jgi:arylsulfatase A-like enzyme
MNEYAAIEVAQPADVFPPRLGKPDWAQKVNHWERGPDGTPMSNKRPLTSWVRQYHQGVNAIDEGVKRLLQALEESGQRKNTLIVFTSDQGLAFGQHGFLGTKIAAYDANIRSPMIVSMPGRIPEGVVCQAPVVGIDLVPTFFRFAGINLPWEMHGRDLSPLFKNPQANWPHPAMLTATGQKFGSDTNVIPDGKGVYHGDVPWYVMIRERRYKYVRPLIRDLEELYDMQQDPEELDNLAVKPEHRKTLVRLRTIAIAELRRSKAGFVDRMPPVREAVLNH